MLSQRSHFMNSVLLSPQTFSCAVDSFLESSSLLYHSYHKEMNLESFFLQPIQDIFSRLETVDYCQI